MFALFTASYLSLANEAEKPENSTRAETEDTVKTENASLPLNETQSR